VSNDVVIRTPFTSNVLETHDEARGGLPAISRNYPSVYIEAHFELAAEPQQYYDGAINTIR
jgi:hypothetical protein